MMLNTMKIEVIEFEQNYQLQYISKFISYFNIQLLTIMNK